ncbi:MAG: recombinase family protein [Desulfoferrobacter sp.]
MKVVGYIRVSTQGQVNDGVSLDAQQTKIRSWAELNDYDCPTIFTDAGISGSQVDNRDGLKTALDSVKKGDAFVVYSLSRLTRSTKTTLEIADMLNQKGADLVSISEQLDTSSAAGKMLFRMLAVLNEFERDQIVERTKAALNYKQQNGERTGGIRYGYRVDEDGKTLIENPEEQQVIHAARDLRGQSMSLQGIAKELAKRGFRSRTGREFCATQVKRMLAA